MNGTVGDDLPGLLGHQVDQLVDQEGRGEGHDPARGDPDQFSTYRAPEAELPGVRGDDPLEAGDADGVGAGEQLGTMFSAIVAAETRGARQEWFVKVLIVDGDGLHQGALYWSPSNIFPGIKLIENI